MLGFLDGSGNWHEGRSLGLAEQDETSFAVELVALARIDVLVRENEVFPCILAAPVTRNDVIEVTTLAGKLLAAVLTDTLVALPDCAGAETWAMNWNTSVVGRDNDGRYTNLHPRSVDRQIAGTDWKLYPVIPFYRIGVDKDVLATFILGHLDVEGKSGLLTIGLRAETYDSLANGTNANDLPVLVELEDELFVEYAIHKVNSVLFV